MARQVMTLTQIAKDEKLLEVGRKAIEVALIEMRESRISQPYRGNGLVVREKDGSPSDLIRFGPEDGLRIGLKAIAAKLSKRKK